MGNSLLSEAPAAAIDETAIDETAIDETAIDETAIDETAIDSKNNLIQEEDETQSPEIDANGSGSQDGYFSIRGEVLYYASDEKRLVVKIQQLPRPGSEQGKMFKLNLNGALPSNKSVGYFWDLKVQRQDNQLVVRDGSVIGLVPPKKRKPGDKEAPDRRKGGGQGAFRKPQRPNLNSRPTGDRPTVAPLPRREPIEKPVKRPKSADQ
jgi:hypothetical protein